MRTKLGRVAALSMLIITAVAGVVDVASASPAPSVPPGSAQATATTTTTTTTTTVVADTTTTLPPVATTPPLVVDVPAAVTPSRGTQRQVTDTLPPPPTIPFGELPANSGEGRRIVYSKSQQRVWTVEADGTVSKTHLVSGRRTWNQPSPGTYSVFSRSSYTCNIRNPAICWRYMVRFARGPDGDNIGFHEIPRRDGVPVQSESQLGTPLSGGCVRQATPDAVYVWNWAPVGTPVVVLG